MAIGFSTFYPQIGDSNPTQRDAALAAGSISSTHYTVSTGSTLTQFKSLSQMSTAGKLTVKIGSDSICAIPLLLNS